MLWGLKRLGEEKDPAEEQKRPVRQAESWVHRCPESRGRECLDSGHVSFKL